MTSRLPWIALAIGAYLAFLFSQFPAAKAINWFAPAEFSASGITGTVWSGSAALASVPDLPMRDLRWSIRGASLLIGRLSGQLSARLSGGFVESEFSNSLSTTRLRQLRTSTSLETLSGFLPVSGAHGQVSIALGELIVSDGWPTAMVGTIGLSQLEVEPFAGAGNQMITLGDYEVVFAESASPVLQGLISDSSGPLELSGTLSLYSNREYEVEGWLVARPQAQRELVQGLSIMLPEPDASGRRAFSFPGSL